MCKTYQVKYESPFTGFFILDMITKDKEKAMKRKEELMKHYELVIVEVKDES